VITNFGRKEGRRQKQTCTDRDTDTERERERERYPSWMKAST
jgi:hypothetical protein